MPRWRIVGILTSSEFELLQFSANFEVSGQESEMDTNFSDSEENDVYFIKLYRDERFSDKGLYAEESSKHTCFG